MEGFLDDLYTDLSDLFWGILESLIDLFTDIVELLPAPEFLDGLAGYMSNIPADVVFLLAPFEFDYGFSVINAAIFARLTLSLIPYIGGAFR